MPFGKKYNKPYQQPAPSPIEVSFWETAKPLIPELEREVWIDTYFVELGPKQWGFENEEGVCRGYSELSPGWPVGRHSFTWLYKLDRMLHNGNDVYEPGEYIIEFIVEVE